MGKKPWEDYSPSPKKGPWDEYSPPVIGSKIPSSMDSFLSGAGDSLSFGWGDEIQGGLAGLGSAFSGGDYWSGYNKSVNDARSWQRVSELYEPGAYLGGELGGALLGGLAIGGGVGLAGNLARGGAVATTALPAARNIGIFGKMAMQAPGAFAGGALYGAGASDGGEHGDMLTNAALGGVGGAAFGAALSGLGSAGKKILVDPLLDLMPKRSTAKYVEGLLPRYNLNGQVIQDSIDNLSSFEGGTIDAAGKVAKHGEHLPYDPATGAYLPYDTKSPDFRASAAWNMDALGPLGSDLAKASAVHGGPELAAMEAAAKMRNAGVADNARRSWWNKLFPGKGERINYVSRVSDIDQELSSFDTIYDKIDAGVLDPTNLPPELRKFVANNSREAYKIQTGRGRQTRDLNSSLIGHFPEAMKAAKNMMRAELGADVPEYVLMSKPKFWRTLLTAARNEKDGAWQGTNKADAMNKSHEYDRLKSWLGHDDALGKDWVSAQERYAALKSERDGLEFGFNAILKTDAPSLADNFKLFNQMSPEQQDWARKGMVLRLEDGIRSQQTRGGTRDMMRRIANDPTQEEAINRFFGRVKGDGSADLRFKNIKSVLDDLDARYELFDNIERSAILKGPKTASSLTMAGNQADATMPAAGELLKGNIFGALRKAFLGDGVETFNPEVANDIIKFVRKPLRITDKAGTLVGGLEHEIKSAGGYVKWLDGKSVIQKALKRQYNRQMAYKNRWADMRSSVYGGVGGGTVLDMLKSE